MKVSARDLLSYLCNSDDAKIPYRVGLETETADITMLANLASSYRNIRRMVFFPVDKQAMIHSAAAGCGVLPKSTWRASASVTINVNGFLKAGRAASI